jgi:hypothetical protein
MKLLTNYKKNGYQFSLIERAGAFAAFKGERVGGMSTWEVIEVQSHDGLILFGDYCPPAEYPPSNAQWGVKGWTYMSEEKALGRLVELTKEARN